MQVNGTRVTHCTHIDVVNLIKCKCHSFLSCACATPLPRRRIRLSARSASVASALFAGRRRDDVMKFDAAPRFACSQGPSRLRPCLNQQSYNNNATLDCTENRSASARVVAGGRSTLRGASRARQHRHVPKRLTCLFVPSVLIDQTLSLASSPTPPTRQRYIDNDQLDKLPLREHPRRITPVVICLFFALLSSRSRFPCSPLSNPSCQQDSFALTHALTVSISRVSSNRF